MLVNQLFNIYVNSVSDTITPYICFARFEWLNDIMLLL